MSADDKSILAGARVATRLPAQDLDRARRFYTEQEIERNYPSKSERSGLVLGPGVP